jgi:hypothetical protein
MFYGDQAGVDDLLRSIEDSRDMTTSMLAELAGFVRAYLEPGGPLSILEQDGARNAAVRDQLRGRPLFPERLHVIALVLDVTTDLLAELEASLAAVADEVRTWPSTTDPKLAPRTRARLERINRRTSGAED